MQNPDTDDLHEQAYAAFERGALKEASIRFAALLQSDPDWANYHYMQGLVHKYLRDWPTSLHHNLRSLELRDEPDESSQWNAGIAATALGEWAEARRQWRACSIKVPEGDGPIEKDFGVVSVRLNPWGSGETLFARRIDVVRARLLNVPLQESGHRFGDIVLHDGASTGERELDGRRVPVFNALARLTPSDFQTFVAFVSCDQADDLNDLLESQAPGLGYIEDWTSSVVSFCLRCSYGAAHRHDAGGNKDAWEPDRNLGVAAQSRHSVTRLLEAWQAKGPGRRVDAIEAREHAVPVPEDGFAWWRGPEEDE
ncbi:hypothetical protein [Pseudoxanthomonas sp. CF125]|uniref:hypothetical protein n=1 Tax=Pseudoxanthomonas sp. CF125 TaxID=1855303 RepID=UPI000889919B|nr:hypothetical protein [Pseudoxanthomonas sp. CF125]SDQ26006.1 hypothetical protein SAMN05216569_0340 [Pseudoxanthomonas sp. CF125]